MYDGPPRPSVSKNGLSTAGRHRYDNCFPHVVYWLSRVRRSVISIAVSRPRALLSVS